MSPLSNITNPENKTQFNLVKDPNSKKVNDLLVHNKIPITLYYHLLTNRDTIKRFELKRDLLKMITNKKHNDDLAKLVNKKLLYDFAKAMYFDENLHVKTCPRDRSLMRLLKSPAIMASGISREILPEKPNKLCDRLNLILQESKLVKFLT